MQFISKLKYVALKYPVLRGMATYSLLWPSANFLQQSMDKSRKEVDAKEVFRFFLLGTFATAPTIYAWIKILGYLVKGIQLKHAVIKAALDVVIFAPFGQTQFYLGITLLEGKKWEDCVQEWREKLIPTWKATFGYWPVVQTINYAYVHERNRVIFISFASVIWMMFLSYMHHHSGNDI